MLFCYFWSNEMFFINSPRRMRIFPWVPLLFILICPSAFAAKSKVAETPASLYSEARKSLTALTQAKKATREQWIQVLDKFRPVYEKFPTSPEACKALYATAKLYHELYLKQGQERDFDQALRHYRKVFAEFKGESLADDALYQEGALFLGKKQYVLALVAFKEVLSDFPKGDQVAEAKKRAAELSAFVKTPKESSPPEEAKQVSGAVMTLRKVEFNADSGSARIVIHASGPVQAKQHRLSNPDRFYLDFLNTRLESDLPKDISVQNDILKRIRSSQFDANTSRVVLDFVQMQGLKITMQESGSLVVVELQVPQARTETVIEAKAPGKALKVLPVKASIEKKMVLRGDEDGVPLIVLDPGHGGKDDGAHGETGLLEKDINLDIAGRVKKILESKYKYRVKMTRTDDTYIALDKRGEIANEVGASLFVSVHVNAAPRKTASGIETYYLGSGSTERARDTAARENGEIIYSVPNADVQKILADMISRQKINASADMARTIQDDLTQGMSKKYAGVKNLGVKEGPFFVLHYTNMPSILIEVGFITNRAEEARLKSSNYLEWLAESIAHGIGNFIRAKRSTI